MSGLLVGQAPQANFYMYSGPEFPTPDALLACRGTKRLAPLDEPMVREMIAFEINAI